MVVSLRHSLATAALVAVLASPAAGASAQVVPQPSAASTATAAAPAAPAPAAVAPQEKPAVADTTIDASRGGVTIASGVNSLTINARAQIRWTLDEREAFDADTAGVGAGRPDGVLSGFDVPRLRLTLSGGAYRPWLRYSLQFELGRTSGEGGSRIKDALLEFRPPGRPYRVAVGQFKVPFGLQQLASSSRLQFADRAITDAKFTPGRDMGVMVSGTVRNRTLGYDAGVFNGSGESSRQNNESHLWAGRVFFNPFGQYAASEGALDAAASPVLHVGAGLRGGKQIRGRTAAGIVEEPDNQQAWNLEFGYKRRRIFVTAEQYWMTDEQTNPTAGRDIDSRGGHLQGGYMLLPGVLEVAGLWAHIAADTEVEDAGLTEMRAGVNAFVQGHNLKVQADAGRVRYGENYARLSARARQGMLTLGPRTTAGGEVSDLQVRVQVQLSF